MRRPDTSRIINHGERLILNRAGVRDVADVAASTLVAAQQARRPRSAIYAAGVADLAHWLAGDQPTEELRLLLDITP